MTSRSKDIIFLLGAGASAEAGIPVSREMIERVEDNLNTKDGWKLYHALYNHVKSAIYFAAGLKGSYRDDVPFNIETLVNTLYELERNEEHPLYPFIAAWNSRFVSLAGSGFAEVRSFRRLILIALKTWMCPENPSRSNYYKALVTLQRDLNYPIHIFSLNYDLCVERLSKSGIRIETGFADYGPEHTWGYERFTDMETSSNEPPQIVLYKLHGSIDWKRDPTTKDLFSVEQIESVEADKMEVIFGRDFKLEAADPYLFYAYSFRQLALSTKLIVCLGYGFGDTHINKMLTQSLRSDSGRRLLVVQRCDPNTCTKKRDEIVGALDLIDAQAEQVVVRTGSVKEFLETPDLANILVATLPESKDSPF